MPIPSKVQILHDYRVFAEKTRPVLVPSMSDPEAKKQVILADIHGKWGRLSDADLGGLKDRNDLVSHVAVKYRREMSAAGREVDALLAGRVI